MDTHEVRIHHSLTLSTQIRQQRDGYFLQLERCQKGLRATSPCGRPSAWRGWCELVDLQALEPIGAGRSSADRIRWLQNSLANPDLDS